jgi:hypothetical protein
MLHRDDTSIRAARTARIEVVLEVAKRGDLVLTLVRRASGLQPFMVTATRSDGIVGARFHRTEIDGYRAFVAVARELGLLGS